MLQGTFYDINSSANRGLPTFKTVGQGDRRLARGRLSVQGSPAVTSSNRSAQLVFQNIHINDANDIAAQIRFADVNFARRADRRAVWPDMGI